MKNKHPEFIYMIVELAAYVCTAVVAIVLTRSDTEINSAMIALAVTVFLFSLLAPVMAKAFAYSEILTYRAPKNFNPQYAMKEYDLHGWIKGKYLFLDAIYKVCAGDLPGGYRLYCRCLEKADDKRLRLACYKDMAKNLRRMNSNILLLPHMQAACKEFPNEITFFEWVSDYYLWFDKADEGEGHDWFRSVIDSGVSDRIKARAYYYLGIFSMYHREYAKATDHFRTAYDLYSPAPCYLCIDIAVCMACLGNYDEAREYAVQAASITDSEEDLEYISEKITYLFKAKTGEVNPETEKLMEELRRRREYKAKNAVKIDDLKKINDAIVGK